MAELDEEAEGWEPGKPVGYCLPCARIYTRTSTPRSPEASISANLVDETSSLSKQNDQDSYLSSDSEEKEPQVPYKKTYNTEAYQSVLNKLNEQYEEQ